MGFDGWWLTFFASFSFYVILSTKLWQIDDAEEFQNWKLIQGLSFFDGGLLAVQGVSVLPRLLYRRHCKRTPQACIMALMFE